MIKNVKASNEFDISRLGFIINEKFIIFYTSSSFNNENYDKIL